MFIYAEGATMQHSLHTFLLLAFLLLFAARVIGQAIQRWIPQSFLPPFESFQGSNFPYEFLLLIQIFILFIMFRVTWQVGWGQFVRRKRSARIFAWVGGIYLIGSIARILIGAMLPTAHAWFKAGIPAFFHLVLAGFIIVLAICHSKMPNFETKKI